MKTSRADLVKSGDPVWVWDGSWLPAVVVEPERKFVIIRFGHGCSAPALWPDVRRRDPGANGSDRPLLHTQKRTLGRGT
jgi:hypothetical protein